VLRYLVLGAGRFGQLACQRLSANDAEAEIFLVDQDAQQLAAAAPISAVRPVQMTAATYLAKCLTSAAPPDWIIPAIPQHVAFDWLRQQRPAGEVWRQIPVPLAVGQGLPFAQPGTSRELYLSLGTWQCPDDCPEPPEICYLTGLPRKFNLYDYLAKFSLQDYIAVVIRSHQLAPGVGGYRPEDLWQLRRQVNTATGKIIISTACCCHGVSHALEKLT
jgi:hypothetical protein